MNNDIKAYSINKGVPLWRVSQALGYSDKSSFSRLLRKNIPKDQKEHIKKVIDELAKG